MKSGDRVRNTRSGTEAVVNSVQPALTVTFNGVPVQRSRGYVTVYVAPTAHCGTTDYVYQYKHRIRRWRIANTEVIHADQQ